MKLEGQDLTIGLVFYNEGPVIQSCLDSILSELKKCSAQNVNWVFVYTGPKSDPTETLKLVKEWLLHHPVPHSLFHCPENNIAMARNWVARNATSPWIYFTDPDCLQIPGRSLSFLYKQRQLFNKIAALGGQNRPLGVSWVDRTIRQCRRMFFGHFFSSQMMEISENRYVDHLPTCHFLGVAAVLRAFPFREELAAVGEDLEWGLRVNHKGFGLIQLSDSAIFHRQPKNLKLWIQKVFRYGQAQIKVLWLSPQILKGPRLAPLIGGLIYLAVVFGTRPLIALSLAMIYLLVLLSACVVFAKKPFSVFIFILLTQMAYGLGQLFEFIKSPTRIFFWFQHATKPPTPTKV